MIIVLDTNIWKSNLYLKAGAAAALRFYMQQKGAKVGLPEVIRLEVEHHLRADLMGLRSRLAADHQRLLGIVGDLTELALPDDARIDDIVTGFIARLGFDTHEVPLTIEAARSSFLRTIDKVPPSRNSQQFKDGVIWAECLNFAQVENVILATNDKAFFEGEDTRRGLAAPLEQEAAGLPHKIIVVASLGDLLAEMKAPVSIDDDLLLRAIDEQLASQLDGLAEQNGFSRAGAATVTKNFYATETANALFLEFTAQIPYEDTTGTGRVEAMMTVVGDGQFSTSERRFVGLSPTEMGITYHTAEGIPEERRNVYLRAMGMTLGSRTVRHKVREPL
ncbi:PIN domain-containing protein [Mesorhizobium sp. L103C131B0]|uniref:PIN domain-containing protein n=1 Tax=Mesorhizobium sp. L103C131B0 TaxID=1287089 RepID=UPI0003D02164|nr:PIN domain-containing protein [Mesorhizobium sp. L103C131B0]ESZ61979.1 hypothetical protein X729_13005 [Mesorhizobium sp. L103C131B0]